MATILSAGDTKTLICKYLSELPPIVGDWQLSCKEPRCSHYCNGACCNPGRQTASAPCPFDGKELPLVDTEPVNSNDPMPDDGPWQPRWTTPGVPKKG
jgi:hypothetical protein